MKNYLLRVLVIAIVGGVCSSARNGIQDLTPSFITALNDMQNLTSSFIIAGNDIQDIISMLRRRESSAPLLVGSKGIGRSVLVGSIASDGLNRSAERAEKLNSVLDENLPLPRAMILRQLGLPLHNWLAAEVQDVKDIVAMRMKHLTDGSHVGGDELLDLGLARYLPSVYALSADDVLASADVLDDFGNPIATGRHSHEKVFNLQDVVRIVNKSLGDTGRRELINNLNRLEVEETAELMRNLSVAWILRLAQAAAEAEAEDAEASPPSFLDSWLTATIAKKQSRLELDEEIRTRSPAFAPSAQEIAQQEEEISNLQTIDAMPHSAERDTVIAEFHADYLTASNSLYIFTKRDLAWLQRTKIGQAALQDINLSALAALDQVGDLYYLYITSDSYVPVNPGDKRLQEQLLDLLDEHVQQALATK